MKYSAILGILLPLALAVMAAANPANPGKPALIGWILIFSYSIYYCQSIHIL